MTFLAFGAAVVWSLGTEATAAPDADASLVAEDVSFSHTGLAARSGEVTVALANEDLFWHTFTIQELGVDLLVPVGAVRTVTFDAPAGTYEFICRIPGHPEAGMKGTLTIRG